MSDPDNSAAGARRTIARRRSVALGADDLVRAGALESGGPLPLLVTPAVDGLDPVAWLGANRARLEGWLAQHGGVLLRGFALEQVDDFERAIGAASDGWAEYREPATPRSQVSGNIYTSTDYPPAQRIFLHNENSHTESWPMKIFFFCQVPALERGATPLADCRRVYAALDPDVRARLAGRGIMYVRNFGQGLGYDWRAVFKTDDPAAVERYCRENGIVAEWKAGGGLRIRYVRPAAARHPRTGEPVWFNHGTFFHISTQEPAIREALLQSLDEEDLPYNTFYGDGARIEPEVIEHLRAAYERETVAFPWRRGDLLVLDNMLVAHGREPFVGPRRVLVGMAEPCRWSDLAGQL